MTADEIIDGLGGTSKVADELHLTPSTVSSWKTANHVPRWWHAQLLELAARAEFRLASVDFPKRQSRKQSADSGQAAA